MSDRGPEAFSKRIEEIDDDRQEAHRFFYARSDVYRTIVELERKTFRDGKLSRKEKELIAVGISIVNDCESCLDWHIKQALGAGATTEEVIEAIEVGFEMGISPTTVTGRFAMKVLGHYMKEGGTGTAGKAARTPRKG